MPQGTIKKIVADRGFGFISGDSGDVFFHLSVLDEGVDFETLADACTQLPLRRRTGNRQIRRNRPNSACRGVR